MCVFSGFFVFQANLGPSFGHRISDLQEVPNPLFHCFLQGICNTSEVGVLKRTRGFRSAGKNMNLASSQQVYSVRTLTYIYT